MNSTCDVLTRKNGKMDYEAVWVAGAKAGSVRCFEGLVRRNSAMILHVAVQITQNEEDAEDAMQETFVKAYRHLDQFRGDSRFSTWLIRIAINEALLKLRQRQSNRFALPRRSETFEEVIPHEVQDWRPNPEQLYERTELQQIVSQAISKLELAYRMVLTLRDIQGLTTKETAELLGLSLSATKSRLLRARLMMRQNLSEHFQNAPALA